MGAVGSPGASPGAGRGGLPIKPSVLAYVHTQTASFDTWKKPCVHPAVASAPSTAPRPSAHATATAVRSDGAQMIRLRTSSAVPQSKDCTTRDVFSQVRLAGVASCCCTLAARSVVATKVRAARARVDENGAARIISSTITARPTRPVRCYNTYTAAAPCPHPARSQVTTWTQGGRPPPRQPTSPTCGAPLHRRRTAKFAAGRAAVSA